MFTFEDLSRRRCAPEILDTPGLDPREHAAALNGLERLNVLAFHVAPFWREIAPLARRHSRPLRVLDVACGGGGLVCGLRRRAAQAGIPMVVDGCDRSDVAVANAEERARRTATDGGRFFVCDLLLDGVPEGYDVVTNTLFLHHLNEADAGVFIAEMARKSGQLMLLSDILRTRIGWWMVRAACTVFGASRVVVEDGMTSLRAAFSLEELNALLHAAGLQGAHVRRHWPERALVRWERPRN